MSSANNKRLFVISYRESMLILLLFTMVLILLYPKDMIEKQVLRESSNYDLTIAYLKNLLKNDPKNEKMLLTLAHTAQKTANYDLALKLIDMLKTSENIRLKEEIYTLKYFLLKHKFQENEVENEEELRNLLQHIVNNKNLDTESLTIWHNEALLLKEDKLAFILAKRALKKNPKSVYWLKNVYAFASIFDENTLKDNILEKLVLYDKEDMFLWQKERYYTAINEKEYHKAKILLMSLDFTASFRKIQLAQLALNEKEYMKASRFYEELSLDASKIEVKKKWLLKSVQALQYGNFMQEAATLAKKHEDKYFDDRKLMQDFLKLYLAAGVLDYASELSKKLLKYEENYP